MNGGSRGRAEAARLAGWLDLAERGWRLFPLRPGSKVPAIMDWSARATSDPDRLVRFFRAHPDHNAGIACGPSGLLVVDCDVPKSDLDRRAGQPRDGVLVFDRLADEHGGPVQTWTVGTPSGGQHRYYAAPPGVVLGNTSRVLGQMVDTRGAGGQVVAPGSVLPAGGYMLLDDIDPAPLPGWVTTWLTPAPATAAPADAARVVGQALSARQAAYVAAAVAAETDRVRQAGRGGHNGAVFTAANSLGQLVGAGALTRAEAEAAITDAAQHICAGPCDCTPREVAASIRSGLDRGTRNPRRLPSGPRTDARSDAAGGDTVTTPRDDTSGTPSIAEIAALTSRLRALSAAGRHAGLAERAALLTEKEALLARITDADTAATATSSQPPSDQADRPQADLDQGTGQADDEADAADLTSPIPYQLTDLGERDHPAPGETFETAGGDSPEVVAAWAPVGADEEVISALATVARLAERGVAAEDAAAAVSTYLDDVSRSTGVDLDRWGLDSHDLDAITQSGRIAATVPEPRHAPDTDEGARRAQLAGWHADDRGAAEPAGLDGGWTR